MIAKITNPTLRRVVLAVATPPLLIVAALLGAAIGAWVELTETLPSVAYAWRGGRK
ncbi:MAG: hypothetical protein P4M09_22920 [Devosia sp.]|nr:hypothetical protein [Devosia sp.]